MNILIVLPLEKASYNENFYTLEFSKEDSLKSLCVMKKNVKRVIWNDNDVFIVWED